MADAFERPLQPRGWRLPASRVSKRLRSWPPQGRRTAWPGQDRCRLAAQRQVWYGLFWLWVPHGKVRRWWAGLSSRHRPVCWFFNSTAPSG